MTKLHPHLPLAVAGAFHTHYMTPAQDAVADAASASGLGIAAPAPEPARPAAGSGAAAGGDAAAVAPVPRIRLSARTGAGLDAMRARGLAYGWLGTNVHNHRANAFYERIGFRIVGERTFRVAGHAETDFTRLIAL